MKCLVLISALLLSLNLAHADSRKLCGHNLNFNPVPVAANVPASIKAFSGIWVGKLVLTSTFSLCTSFVVQEVDASGKFSLVRAWGNADNGGGFAGSIGKEETPLVGQISEGTLNLNTPKSTYTLRVSKDNPNRLEGFYFSNSNGGRFPMFLDRVP